jgi:hypothetical protein
MVGLEDRSDRARLRRAPIEDPPVIARHAQKGHTMNDRKRENAGPRQATLNRWEGEGGALPTPDTRDAVPQLAVRRPEAFSYTQITPTAESMRPVLRVPFSHENAPRGARARVRNGPR